MSGRSERPGPRDAGGPAATPVSTTHLTSGSHPTPLVPLPGLRDRPQGPALSTPCKSCVGQRLEGKAGRHPRFCPCKDLVR